MPTVQQVLEQREELELRAMLRCAADNGGWIVVSDLVSVQRARALKNRGLFVVSQDGKMVRAALTKRGRDEVRRMLEERAKMASRGSKRRRVPVDHGPAKYPTPAEQLEARLEGYKLRRVVAFSRGKALHSWGDD